MRLLFFTIFVIAVCFMFCKEPNRSNLSETKPGRDDIAEMNSYMVRKDRERIQSYSERKGIIMKESSTGLWYNIVKEGVGDYLAENELIVFEYDCFLLDGTACYSSDETGPKEISLGKSELPSGLNEGLRMLKHGAEAIFILPPHLAYGLIGDGRKIPPRSTMVYSIRIIN